MTILEALQWAERELKSTLQEKSTEAHHPKFDAQVLLAFTLQKQNAYLFSHVDQELTPAQITTFKNYIARRKNHEPVAYIKETKEFYGRPFFVNKNVLIPRPETELIIDLAKEHAQPNSIIIDVGTGSGAIAITLALETHTPTIAIDISEEALNIAKQNAEAANAQNRIAFFQGNILEPYLAKAPKHGTAHTIITANLPYIRERQWEQLDPDVKKFEPKLALTAGIDGLDLYDQLFQQIQSHRNAIGKKIDIFIEIDPDQASSGKLLAEEYFKETNIETYQDLSKLPRIIHVKI